MANGWFTPLAGQTIDPLVDVGVITPSDEPQSAALSAHPAPADPWNPGAKSRAPSAALAAAARLALGANLTTTPEYLAANLPPYNSQS